MYKRRGISNWTFNTSSTLRHYILGFLASENIIGAMSERNAVSAVRRIVIKFLGKLCLKDLKDTEKNLKPLQ